MVLKCVIQRLPRLQEREIFLDCARKVIDIRAPIEHDWAFTTLQKLALVSDLILDKWTKSSKEDIEILSSASTLLGRTLFPSLGELAPNIIADIAWNLGLSQSNDLQCFEYIATLVKSAPIQFSCSDLAKIMDGLSKACFLDEDFLNTCAQRIVMSGESTSNPSGFAASISSLSKSKLDLDGFWFQKLLEEIRSFDFKVLSPTDISSLTSAFVVICAPETLGTQDVKFLNQVSNYALTRLNEFSDKHLKILIWAFVPACATLVFDFYKSVSSRRVLRGKSFYSALLTAAELHNDQEKVIQGLVHFSRSPEASHAVTYILNAALIKCLQGKHWSQIEEVILEIKTRRCENSTTVTICDDLGIHPSWGEYCNENKSAVSERTTVGVKFLNYLECECPGLLAPKEVLGIFEEFSQQKEWLKICGRKKTEIIRRACSSTSLEPRLFLEFGCFLGYSAIQARLALGNGGKVVSVESDPLNAALAINVIQKAGLSDSIIVKLGRSTEVIQSLTDEKVGSLKPTVIFLDHRGTIYHKDMLALEEAGLIRAGTEILADNVLCPGAPIFAHYVKESSRFQVWTNKLKEFNRDYEDVLLSVKAVEAQNQRSGAAQSSLFEKTPTCFDLIINTPLRLRRLGRIIDSLCFASQHGRVSADYWKIHSEEMKSELADIF